jgi:HK97 family phage prohead protease
MTERRIVVGQVRAAAMSGKAMRVSGLAARYNSPTIIGTARGGFIERFVRGAFSRAIDARQDTALLINHDANRLMARISSGTLRLRDTEDGLEFDADLPDTEDARTAYAAIQRGDMHQCSVSWSGQDADWDSDVDPADRTKKLPRRTIRNIETLHDVSAVTFPAYSDTKVVARSVEQRSEIVIPEEFIVAPPAEEDSVEVIERRRRLLNLASL